MFTTFLTPKEIAMVKFKKKKTLFIVFFQLFQSPFVSKQLNKKCKKNFFYFNKLLTFNK